MSKYRELLPDDDFSTEKAIEKMSEILDEIENDVASALGELTSISSVDDLHRIEICKNELEELKNNLY